MNGEQNDKDCVFCFPGNEILNDQVVKDLGLITDGKLSSDEHCKGM